MRLPKVRGWSYLLLVAGALAIAVTAGTSASSTTSAATTPDAKLVRAVEQRLLRGLLTKNYDAVDELLASDFELITPTGDVVSKELYLAGLAFTYKRFEPITPIRVRVHGDAAVIRYEAAIRIGGGVSGRDWHTDLFEKRAGRWKMVWSQATAAA
jgi:hypothetical protein